MLGLSYSDDPEKFSMVTKMNSNFEAPENHLELIIKCRFLFNMRDRSSVCTNISNYDAMVPVVWLNINLDAAVRIFYST